MSSPQPARGPEAGSREQILEAALRCFSELGYDGASTREIASRAGVNLGLITYYFGGKEQLWREAVARAFAGLEEGLGEAPAETGADGYREQLRRMLRRYVRWIARHPEFIRLMHEEGKREGPRMRWLVDRYVRPLFERTHATLCEGQQRGLLPAEVDPLHLHYILIGALDLVFHQAPECRRLTGREPSEDAFADAHADAVTRLLLGPET